MASDYLFGIFKLFLSFLFWPLCCLSFFHLWLLITSLVSSNFSCHFYFGHCVVCLPSMASDYLFGIFKLFLSFLFWPLCCLSFFHLLLLITSDIFKLFLSFLFWPLCCLSFFHLWLLITSLTSSIFSCPFYFGHCVVYPSSIYGF